MQDGINGKLLWVGDDMVRYDSEFRLVHIDNTESKEQRDVVGIHIA